MKKRLSAFLTALLLCLLLLPLTVTTARAADTDEIVNYDITVEPSVDDGSLLFTVSFDWKVLETLDHGTELKIGIPNGAIRERKVLTDNIERLSNDNSYMFVYLNRTVKAGETVHFAYSWVQQYMYTLDGDAVNFDYTPGWFPDFKIDHMTVTWKSPAGVDGKVRYEADDPDCWSASGETVTGRNLPHGSTVRLIVDYPYWPVGLNEGMTRENIPEDYMSGYSDDGDGWIIPLIVVVLIVVIFIVIPYLATRRDGYAGGFGTHYVFVNNLWYPAGADGKPKPGSTGTVHKPKPPVTHSSGGFGGGSRGGGFGGGGFGGGSHCACASSCACACACACAGGGRAGCSAKNLYGAVKLDEKLSRALERETGFPRR